MHPLQWGHNECDSVSNNRRLDCLLNRLFTRWSNKISKLPVTGLCAGNSPVTARKASNAENVPFDDVIMASKHSAVTLLHSGRWHHTCSCGEIQWKYYKRDSNHLTTGLIILDFIHFFSTFCQFNDSCPMWWPSWTSVHDLPARDIWGFDLITLGPHFVHSNNGGRQNALDSSIAGF